MKSAHMTASQAVILDVIQSYPALSAIDLSKQIDAELALAMEAAREFERAPKPKAKLALVTAEWHAANPAPRKSRADRAAPFKPEIVR